MARTRTTQLIDDNDEALYLSSHLRPPHYSIGLVDRPRLTALLEKAGSQRLVLLHAPAGFGKTTVLYQWTSRLQSAGATVCWLSVDKEDSDSYRFLYHLQCAIAAGRNKGSPLSKLAGRSFLKKTLQADVDEAITQLLANERRLLLVIDDYHLAESEKNDRILDEVVKALSDQVTLAISSRVKPALSLPYFKCQGLLASIDASTLRFSEDECHELFKGSGLDWAAASVYRQSGGWPMALQLAKLWLREGADPNRQCELDATASGITEYLTGEVIRKLPREVADMIIETSVLERVNGDIANHLTGRTDCWSLIGMLEELDALIVPLQGRGGWFRYHQLFREFLQGQLAKRSAQHMANLHRRASYWFWEQGDIENAVMHAAHAGETERIAEMIESEGAVRIGLIKGMPVLQRLLLPLSAQDIYAHPRLHLAQIWLLTKLGEVAIARRQYDQYFDHVTYGSGATTFGYSETEKESLFVGMMLAEVYEDRNFDRTDIERIESMATDVSVVDHWFQGWVNNLLCVMHTRKGNFDKAIAVNEAANFHYQKVGSEYGQVWMLLHHALLSLLDGRLRTAEGSIGKAISWAQESFSNDSGLISIVRIVESLVLLEQSETKRAADLVFDALATAEKAEGWVEIFVHGYRVATELSCLHQGFGQGIRQLDRAFEFARDRSLSRLAQALALLQIELLTLDGRIDDAMRVARMHHFSMDAEPKLSEEGWRERVCKLVVLGRLAIYQGRSAEILPVLRAYMEDAQRCDRRRAVMELALVRAMAEYECDHRDECVSSLREALGIAVPEGFRQVFVKEGRLMARMLDVMIRHLGASSMSKDAISFLASLITRLRQTGRGAGSPANSNILTDKQLAVLGHLEKGSPNKIIARNLGISVATVKFHLSNIFRKLGVGSRIMAVAIAKEKELF